MPDATADHLSEDQFRSFLIENDPEDPGSGMNRIEQETEEIMQAVQTVIDEADMFPDETERQDALFRITEYINHLECESTSDPTRPFRLAAPLRNIKSFMKFKDGKMLKAYVISLYEKCMRAEDQARYEQWKAQFLNQYLPDNDNPPNENIHQRRNITGADMALTTKERTVQIMGNSARWLLKAVMKVPQQLLGYEITTTLDEILTAMGTQWGQFFTTLGISLGAVGVVAIYNYWCYHRGTRTLERAKKSFVDNSAAVLVGNLAGFGVNAVLSAIFGPFGWVLGLIFQGAVGWVVGSITRHYVSHWTTKYFEIPKQEALEEAYNTIGLPRTASDNDISRKYRELSKEHHPDHLQRLDDPPDDEGIQEHVKEFIKIQKAYKLIKTMREAEEAGKDHDDNLDWKQNFMLFVKNLFSLRKKDIANEEEMMRAINFETLGFPPEEAYETPNQTRNHDPDAPLRTVGVGMRNEAVRSCWWQHFWTAIGSSQ